VSFLHYILISCGNFGVKKTIVTKLCNFVLGAVSSIPIPGGWVLCPVKNMGGKVLIRLWIKIFPLFFTGQTTPLTKLPLFFTFPYFFNLHLFIKLTPYFSIFSNQTFLPYFLPPPCCSMYTLNKTLPIVGRSLKWRGKLESEIGGGTWAQNCGWGKLRPILIPDLGW